MIEINYKDLLLVFFIFDYHINGPSIALVGYNKEQHVSLINFKYIFNIAEKGCAGGLKETTIILSHRFVMELLHWHKVCELGGDKLHRPPMVALNCLNILIVFFHTHVKPSQLRPPAPPYSAILSNI